MTPPAGYVHFPNPITASEAGARYSQPALVRQGGDDSLQVWVELVPVLLVG